MSRTDAELLNAWTHRDDAAAFHQLVVRYGGLVYSACVRVLRDPAQAEEVAQDCFLALAAAKAQPADYLAPWLHRVATNLSLKRLRGELRRQTREAAYATAQSHALSEQIDELIGLVQEAINALPDEQRVPIVEHFLNGQTHAAIATRLCIARPTVTVRIDRGIKQIRAHLRRRGVPVAVATVTAALTAPAHAIPAAVTTRLGTIALAGPKALRGEADGILTRALTHPTPAAPSAMVAPSVIMAAVLLLMLSLGGAALRWSRNAPQPQANPSATVVTPPEAHAQGSGQATTEAPAATEKANEDSQAAYTVAGNGRVTGVVLDADGHGVEGAQITLESAYDRLREDLVDAARYTAHAVSGSNGVFAFDGIPLWRSTEAAGYITNTQITAEADGKQAGSLTRISSVFREAFVEVTFQNKIAGDTISGRILPPPGMVLGKFTVDATVKRPWVALELGPIGGDVKVQPDGAFQLTGLLPGIYSIRVDADDFPMQESPAVPTGTSNFQFQLEPGFTATVRTVDASTGEPINDVPLSFDAGGSFSAFWYRGEVRDAMAAEVHTLRGLRPWRYRVDVVGDEWMPVPEDIYLPMLENGPREFTVRLMPGADTRRASNPRAQVAMAPPQVEGVPPAPPTFTSDHDPGPTEDLTAAVSGSVVDAAGAPAFAAVIAAMSVAPEDSPGVVSGPNLIAYSASDGSFTGEIHGKGPFYFQCIHADGISPGAGPFTREELPAISLHFELQAAARVRGSVVDSHGRPLKYAIVTALPADPTGSHLLPTCGVEGPSFHYDNETPHAQARTPESGHFVLPSLYPGPYTLRAEVLIPESEPVSIEIPISLAAGADVGPLVLRVPLGEGTASLAGRVTILGEPAPGMTLSLDNRSQQVTDWRGAFRFLNVAPGDHEFSYMSYLESEFTAYAIRRNVSIAPGEQEVFDLDLASGPCVVEGVVTINGCPIPTYRVRLWPNEETEEHEAVETYTDDHGRYRVEGLYAMQYHVRTEGVGREPWARSYGPSQPIGDPLTAGETRELNLELSSATLDVIIGTARPDTSENATVAIVKDFGNNDYRQGEKLSRRFDHPSIVKTSTPGRTRFTNLPAGDYIALLIDNDTILSRLPLTLPGATATEITAGDSLVLVRQVPDTYTR